MEIIRLVTGYNGTNTYIIINNGGAIAIDPGAWAHKITEQLASHNAELKYILLTHAHFDHVGAVADLKTDGVKVYMSEADTDNYDEIYDIGEDIFVKPFSVDVKLHDGDSFDLLGVDFKAVLTPGHTPGSMCYIVNDTVLFSGDTLFRLSVGRTDFIGGNRTELMQSLKKLFALDCDYEVLPGHGEKTSLFFEREKNPYAR